MLNAASSTVRNIAEGANRWGAGEKRSRFSIAQGEAAELDDTMHLYAAIARRHQGTLIGGDEGRQLIEGADTLMKNEGIVDPARFARMLVPGFDGESPCSVR